MQLLSGQTTLITGATRGIGRAIAELFAASGSNVAFTYFSESSIGLAADMEQTLSTQHGVKVKGYRSDAAQLAAAEQLTAEVLTDFGRVDVLINNAGIARDNLLLRMNEQQWDDVLDNNLKSVFNLTKHIIKPMLKQKKGSIINMSSIIGIRGNAGQANYAAAKAGIIGFSKSVAQELGSRNIRCNVLAPGFIETDMTEKLSPEVKENYIKGIPLQRFAQPDEVAKAALFLASDLSSYITGQVLSVCGGLTQ